MSGLTQWANRYAVIPVMKLPVKLTGGVLTEYGL